MWIDFLLIIILGLCLGSFFNVLIYRWSNRLSIFSPIFSFCPHCKNPIKWYYNLPIISYLWLKGKCKICKKPISPFYPLVEFLTSFLFLISYLYFKKYSFFTFLGFSFFVLILIPITFIDLKIREIPDKLSLVLIGWGWIFSLTGFNFLLDFKTSLISSLAGIGLLFLINEFYYQFSKREGIGMGDFKLMGGIGAFLGFESFFSIIFLASLSGVLAFLGFYLLNKIFKGKENKLEFKTEIPFGPFLSLASLVYLFGFKIEKILFL
ncbi:MAG: prepilin peptidase [Thermodesulfobacteriaceae bacterium]|nr:prepilin peptidase [Thermodesulfobacteriaceae bacterium]MDW8136162.1 prepilin peptidase [Thermodesulfobacterium sp.]